MAKDYTKYRFEEETYCKNRLVLAVVKKYLKGNPTTTVDELKKIFSDKLHKNPRLGVFQTVESAMGGERRDPEKRYFMKPAELLLTGDGKKICVCSQWGFDRHREFVEYVRKELKYKIVSLGPR